MIEQPTTRSAQKRQNIVHYSNCNKTEEHFKTTKKCIVNKGEVLNQVVNSGERRTVFCPLQSVAYSILPVALALIFQFLFIHLARVDNAIYQIALFVLLNLPTG